jgi:hypothetical protein
VHRLVNEKTLIIHAISILCAMMCIHNIAPSWIWVSSHNLTLCASFCHYAVVMLHIFQNSKHFWMWQSLSESHPWVTGYKQVRIWGASLSDSVRLSIIWRTYLRDYTLPLSEECLVCDIIYIYNVYYLRHFRMWYSVHCPLSVCDGQRMSFQNFDSLHYTVNKVSAGCTVYWTIRVKQNHMNVGRRPHVICCDS